MTGMVQKQDSTQGLGGLWLQRPHHPSLPITPLSVSTDDSKEGGEDEAASN